VSVISQFDGLMIEFSDGSRCRIGRSLEELKTGLEGRSSATGLPQGINRAAPSPLTY